MFCVVNTSVKYHLNSLSTSVSCFLTTAQDTINRRLIAGIVAPRISAYWDTVAAYLEYPIASTREIDRQCRGDPRQCCITLLEDWFTGKTGVEPKEWSTLVDVLSEISDIAAATQEIKRLLRNERVI